MPESELFGVVRRRWRPGQGRNEGRVGRPGDRTLGRAGGLRDDWRRRPRPAGRRCCRSTPNRPNRQGASEQQPEMPHSYAEFSRKANRYSVSTSVRPRFGIRVPGRMAGGSLSQARK